MSMAQFFLVFFYHLERENHRGNAIICVNDLGNKLMNSALLKDGRLLVALFGWVTQTDWNLCSNVIRNDPAYRDKKVLLIGWIGNKPGNAKNVRAMVWSGNNSIYRDAIADRDPEGFWWLNFSSAWYP